METPADGLVTTHGTAARQESPASRSGVETNDTRSVANRSYTLRRRLKEFANRVPDACVRCALPVECPA